jgi:hypothetical protein
MSNDSITIAGEVVLSKLYLYSGDEKTKIDISGMMVEVDIYEDIFSHTLSGSVTMTENFNLIHDLPIICEEVIEIEFYTPSIQTRFYKQFFVYKIGRRLIDGNTKNVYLLNIVSIESLKDLNTKISKAFSGMPHDIINEIFTRYLKVDSKLDTSQSTNLIKFISPYWSPFKCINYAASKSISADKYKTPTYLFYETNQKFKFRSLNELFKTNPVTEFFYDKNNMRTMTEDGESSRDIDREFKQVETFDIIEATDYIDRLMNGVYSFKVFDVNILNKTITKQVYNYWDNFEDTNHLGKNPMHSEYVTFDDENCRIEWLITNPHVHNVIKKDLNAEILSKRLPLLAQTEMFSIEITVPGRLGIECGDTAIFNLMNYELKKEEDLKLKDMDKYYSGKYLITSIEHRLTKTRHKMNLQLIKESFENKVDFKKEL